jgi:hypothetical protein
MTAIAQRLPFKAKCKGLSPRLRKQVDRIDFFDLLGTNLILLQPAIKSSKERTSDLDKRY